jgi:hypothetical protein
MFSRIITALSTSIPIFRFEIQELATSSIMIPSSSFLVATVLLVLTIGTILEQRVLLVSGFEFDHDVDAELCKNDIISDPDVCTSNSTMWFSCPISCARALHGGRGTMAEQRSDPEQFYELHAKRVAGTNYNKGSDMSLEDNEGYITLYAVLPMLSGMAEYYYDTIEHISKVYKYSLVAMILPYYDTTNEQDDSKPSSSTSILQSIVGSRSSRETHGKKETKTKSILLTGYDVQQNAHNEVLEYLLTREVVAGTLDPQYPDRHYDNDNTLLITRPNIFIVSHTGMFIERVVSPTMEVIERRIKVHELAMEENFEL